MFNSNELCSEFLAKNYINEKLKVFLDSRPASLIGGASYLSTTLYHRLPPILTPSTSGCSICCKSCHKPTYYPDEQTVLSLPSNTALVNVINRQVVNTYKKVKV